jgi:predicted MPP superfamily phosphohydrolase
MRRFKLQYLSDLHLEHYCKLYNKLPFIRKKADNIALLGDIGNPYEHSYKKFIHSMSNQYENVFLLSGNHEYYHNEMNEVDDKINKLCDQYNNVHYMNNNVVTIDDVSIIGTTLWSHINKNEMEYIKNHMNDYRLIKYGDNLITPQIINDIHDDNVSWLKDVINENVNNEVANKRVVVLSHHAPSYKMIPDKYKNSGNHSAFANHLDDIIQEPIVAWLSGHTHGCVTKNINGVICSSNCFGYPLRIDEDYDDNRIEL